MSSILSPCGRLSFRRIFEQNFSRWPMLFLGISKLWWDNIVPMVFFFVSATGLLVLVFVFAFECHSWELDAVFSFTPLAKGLSVLVPVRSDFELCALSVLGLWDALEPSTVGDWSTVFKTNLMIGFLISPPHVPLLQVFLLAASSTDLGFVDWFEMGAGKTKKLKMLN